MSTWASGRCRIGLSGTTRTTGSLVLRRQCTSEGARWSIFGGTANRETGRPWEQDTLALVFSSSKGVLTICALHLAERGALDLDAPVARYWPEFAPLGKQDILF